MSIQLYQFMHLTGTIKTGNYHLCIVLTIIKRANNSHVLFKFSNEVYNFGQGET